MNQKESQTYKILKKIFGKLFKWFFNIKVNEPENIPNEGSVILAGNHKHFLDPILNIVATDRIIHYIAKKELTDNKIIGWFFKKVGCIPVDRNKKNEIAKKEAIALLNNNKVLGIFPEGTRNKTSNILLPFKYGAVSLAKKTNSYIVPFAITGKYKFRSKDLSVRYGKPFKVDNMSLDEANMKLFNEIKKMIEISDIKEKK